MNVNFAPTITQAASGILNGESAVVNDSCECGWQGNTNQRRLVFSATDGWSAACPVCGRLIDLSECTDSYRLQYFQGMARDQGPISLYAAVRN